MVEAASGRDGKVAQPGRAQSVIAMMYPDIFDVPSQSIPPFNACDRVFLRESLEFGVSSLTGSEDTYSLVFLFLTVCKGTSFYRSTREVIEDFDV